MRPIRPTSLLLAMSVVLGYAPKAAATPFAFSYGGRLANSQDQAVNGPVNLELKFFTTASGGSPIGVSPINFNGVTLTDGVFQVDINQLSNAELAMVFDPSHDTYIEVTDKTNNVTYPRQHLSAMPYAMRVPVDANALAFDSSGNLSLAIGAPAANQFLTKDANGKLTWGTPNVPAQSIGGGATVSTTAPNPGQVLTYVSGQWTPTNPGAGGTVTSVTASAPLVVANGTGSSAPALSITQATTTIDGYLSHADYVTFNNKQPPLGYAPLNKAGDTMAGVLNMGGTPIVNMAAPVANNDAATKGYVDTYALKVNGSNGLTAPWAVGNDLTSIGNVGISAQKTLLFGALTNSQETTLVGTLTVGGASPDRGKTWYNATTNQLKYFDGTAAQALGTAGGGISTLSGDVTGTGVSGNAVTTLSNTGVSAGTYMKVTVDAKGRVLAGDTLSASDLPGISATNLLGTVNVGNGGTGSTNFTNNGVVLGNGSSNLLSTIAGSANQVFLVPAAGGTPSFGAINLGQSAAVTGTLPTANGGTGVNSTATFPSSGIIVTEAGAETLTNKTLTTPVIASISNTGTLTLPTTTDTLVGRATTDTLTNKTLTGATINGASTISGSTVINTSGNISAGALSVGGNVGIQGNGTTANKLFLFDKNSSNVLALKAPDTFIGSVTWTLPGFDGSSGQMLTTNGSGTLSWASASDSSKVSKSGDTMSGSLIVQNNVGIGVTTPSNPLHVAANSSGTIPASYGLAVSSQSNPSSKLMIGYDPTLNQALLQSWNSGTPSPLVINPMGGLVSIGNASGTPAVFDIEGGSALSGAGLPIILKAQNGYNSSQGGSIVLMPGTSSNPNVYGNVGIGSGSPAATLDIATNGSGTASLYLNGGGGGGSIRSSSTLTLSAGSGSGTMSLSNAGVSIGTTAPSALLDVYGGHFQSRSASTNKPYVTPASNCGGTAPTIVGNDNSFSISLNVAASSCTINFYSNWSNAPSSCTFSPGNSTAVSGGPYISSITTSAVTLSGSLGNGAIYYVQCF